MTYRNINLRTGPVPAAREGDWVRVMYGRAGDRLTHVKDILAMAEFVKETGRG